ncbi:MAG: hypothetical protein JWN14_4711 [Chthonomonadales bacterium]|nr:hypothetical protein [Chthonomonadales bacterium]
MQPDDKPIMTPKQVAEWMITQLEEADELPQKGAALQIQEQFGDDFVCLDAYGDLGIARRVLYQFRKLTIDDVVWVTEPDNWTTGFWRKRGSGDRPGRKQSYY